MVIKNVQFSFYKKEVASKFTIMKRSALSYKVKKSTLLQEALRRINNVGPGLPWSEVALHLTEYSYMLYLSGYINIERYNFIKGAIIRMETIDAEIAAGLRKSRFRTGDEIREAKISNGGLSLATWFLTKDVCSTVSCQATPGSKLATILQNNINKSSTDGKRKVVLEEGGHPISLGLKKRDPFLTNGCQFNDNDCIMRSDKDCSMMGAIYIIRCISCKERLDP